MSIMETLFGKKPDTTAVPVTGQSTPGNIPANPTVTATAGNGTVPANNVTTGTGAAEENKSPLDEFTKLWETDPNAAANGFQSIINVDPKKLAEAAKKQDFAKNIPAELLQKINAGGPEATAAFSQALNIVSQSGYAQSTYATAKIVESALAKQREEILSQLPAMIKQQNVSDNLRTKNPIFNHPAAAPVLQALQTQLATKHPNATANELQTMAESYLTSLASAATPQKAVDTGLPAGETDWTSFLQ